jgi:uncharacterized protein (DUF169 family)
MDMTFKKRFMEMWGRYFDGADLPIALYYTEEEGRGKLVPPPSGHVCVVPVLSRARKGESLCFQMDSVGCRGGKRYLGFTQEIMPDFEYFLSCGIPGKLEGERYKKSPELVREIYRHIPTFRAPARFIVFKRWDALEERDEPQVVIFFAPPDVLSGLFTLANFDELEPNGVFAPFGAGCATIVQYPYLEREASRPRAILGMFDVSARPFVPNDALTFSAPMNKFVRMVGNMEESFLITGSWEKVLKRIKMKEEGSKAFRESL